MPLGVLLCTSLKQTVGLKVSSGNILTTLQPSKPLLTVAHVVSINWMLSLTGKKPRTKAPRIQRLVTPRVLQHKRRRIALKRQRTQKNKEEASEYAKLLAKRMKVIVLLSLHYLTKIQWGSMK